MRLPSSLVALVALALVAAPAPAFDEAPPGPLAAFDLLGVLPAAPTPAPPGLKDWIFQADPLDPEPLGGRIPVILVHGFESALSHLPFDPARSRHWDRFRSDYRYPGLFAKMKFYTFDFRPWADVRELAHFLVESMVAEVLPAMAPDQELIFMGISAGSLISRHAAVDPRIRPRVANIFSLNGANRGSALASLAKTNGRLVEKLGLVLWRLMRWSRKSVAVSPGVVSLAYDNFDGVITPKMQQRYGILVNPDLKAFNESDPNREKMVVYANRPKSQFGRGRYGVENWLRVRVLTRVHKSFRSADPILHHKSSLFEGAPVALRKVFPGYDHWQLNEIPVVNEMFKDLAATAQGIQARALWRREGGGRP